MQRSAFRLVFVLVLVLRVAICAQPQATYDAISYAIAADAVSSGHNVYVSTQRYNYSPVWAFVIGALWRIAAGELMRFILFVGLLLNAADVAATWLILRIAADGRLADEAGSRRLALLFFANPASVHVTCYLRQFDGLAIVFLLAAIVAAQAGARRGAVDSGRRRGVLAAIALSASILVKHVTALAPLVFARRGRRRGGLPLALAMLPYAVFAASFLPFLSSFRVIRDNVLLYGTGLTGPRGQRPGGFEMLLAAGVGGRYFYFALFALVAAVAIELGRRLPLPRACLLLSLAVLTGAPGFAPQYLVWPIALGSLYPSAGYVLFTTLGAAFMVSDARLAPMPVAVTAMGAWLCALLWFAQELRGALAARRYDDGAAEAFQTSSTASG